MLRLLLIFASVVAVVAVIYWQHSHITKQQAEIAHLRQQAATLIQMREADAEAYRTAIQGREQAAQIAKEGRDALQNINPDADDAAFCDALGRLWRERAASAGGNTPGGVAP